MAPTRPAAGVDGKFDSDTRFPAYSVVRIDTLTAYGSHTPSCCMSTISPELPLMPKVLLGVSACFARSFVSVLWMTHIPGIILVFLSCGALPDSSAVPSRCTWQPAATPPAALLGCGERNLMDSADK